jgi:CubicO group peptidase (beta-lactamase class C family)
MSADDRLAAVRRVVTDAIASQAFPAAVVEVGQRGGVIWREAFGHLTYADDAPACVDDTIFDLASLTKVIATTPLAMRADAEDAFALATRVTDVLSAFDGDDRAAVTVEQLLDHSSGLPAHERLWERGVRGTENYVQAVCATPLDRAPGTSALYSDLGFILLGGLLERVDGRSLDAQFRALPLGMDVHETLRFQPPPEWRSRIAPTEIDPWRGRLLQGEVHDENAAAMGGVAPHAGLFGTAGCVGAYARLVLRTFHEETPLADPALMRRFTRPSQVPGSSRALGWDTMRTTSSCGTKMSASAIGHTGFTGTSLWIDPERDRYVVLLTNRVHPSREHNAMPRVRPALHDALAGL